MAIAPQFQRGPRYGGRTGGRPYIPSTPKRGKRLMKPKAMRMPKGGRPYIEAMREGKLPGKAKGM